jgi:5-methylcytosine-specific restriction protein B
MINNLTDLINASKEFSLSEEIIHNKEKGRHEFITEFPMSSIQTLSLDEYCVGTSNNSFCYWLEFKKILFGIGGGNASKFGIYKSKMVIILQIQGITKLL